MLTFNDLKQWLSDNRIHLAVMLALAAVGLSVGLWASAVILDDALITFRVAENLAYGRGFVFNPGERVQVTTTPLYAMVLAVGTWLFGSAATAAHVLNLTLATLIPVLAYEVGRRLAGMITGISAGLLIPFAPLLVIAFSMESYLYVALILAVMAAYLNERYLLTGVLIGFNTLVRGDAVLLGACLLTYDALVHRRLQWRMIAPAVGLPALWYLFAWGYYGDPFPATLGAKVAQGEFNWLGQRFLDGFLAYWDEWTRVQDYDIFYLIPVLLLLGLVRAVWTDRRWLILIGRDVLYVSAFIGLGVPFAEWYYAPVVPGAMLLTARGIEAVGEGLLRLAQAIKLPPQPSFAVAHTAAALLTVALLSGFQPMTARVIAANPDWKAQVYPDVARWIEAHTNPDANFATIDIGHLGYWSDRHIVDIVGLAQPDVAPFIAQGDFGYAIRHYEPDMVLIGYSWLPEVQAMAWFQQSYVPRHQFRLTSLDEPMMLFSRPQGVKVDDVNIPAAAITPFEANFNQQIRLTGYHLKEPLHAGDSLRLTLFWQAIAPIDVDFTVFVQLVDAENNVLAQRDSRPQNGFYGTTYWHPPEQITDAHAFPLPSELSPGTYDIIVGFYEAETGSRLQLLDEAGQFAGDHIRIEGVAVE